ncbi:MAG: STAS domain-containing protein [Vicinamibacterales bacterium]
MGPQESKLQIEERHVEDITILSLTGQITLDDGDLQFGKKVDSLLKAGRLRILVDLGGVTYIDSSGVGMLAAQVRIVRNKGGALKLVHLTGRSHRTLATMKLVSVFETFEDEASALRSFAWGSDR